jgi:hypothetical protein
MRAHRTQISADLRCAAAEGKAQLAGVVLRVGEDTPAAAGSAHSCEL